MDGAPSTVYTGKGVGQEIESKEGREEYLGGAMGVLFPPVVGQYLPLTFHDKKTTSKGCRVVLNALALN